MMTNSNRSEQYEVVAEDLEYGRVDGTPLVARLYRPRGITGFASVVNVHGGAWVANDRLQMAVINQTIAASGTAVLALDFRMPPVAAYPASVSFKHLTLPTIYLCVDLGGCRILKKKIHDRRSIQQ